jgi:hypothetical protein
MNLFLLKKNVLLPVFIFLYLASNIKAIDIFDDPFLEALMEESPTNPSDAIPRVRPDPATAVDLLQEVGIIDFLRTEVLYLKTNPLNKRNVLDLPIFMSSCEREYCAFFNTELFYNYTNRAAFTYDSCCPDSDFTNINTYLAIAERSLVEKAQTIAEKIKELTMASEFSVDVDRLLSLFHNMTIEQRQFGLMFQGGYGGECFSWNIMLPFYYLERNFFLTDAEQRRIREELGDNQDSEMSFAKKHLISDKLGFGDLRFSIDRTMYHSPRWRLNLGGQITAPSAFCVKRGLYGSAFFKRSSRPTLDILSLLESALPPATPTDALAEFQRFGFNTIDNLSANLLEAPLGNKSVGLTAYIKNKSTLATFIPMPWAHEVRLKSIIRVEYEFPYREKRNFVDNKNPAAFDALNFNDSAQAGTNLLFLETKFVDFFFPYVFDTKVHPGIIVQWTSLYGVCRNCWDYSFGTDTWAKSKERLTNICVPANHQGIPSFDKAPAPFSYQAKVWMSGCYKAQRDHYDFVLTLDGDYTFASSGIGADYSLGLNVEVDF